MNRPPPMTYLMGNAFTVIAVVVLGLAGLYQCWAGDMQWPIGLMAVMAMGAVFRASDHLQAYRQWKRAWDGMEEGAPARRPLFKLTMVVLSILALMIAFTTQDPQARHLAVVFVIVVTVFAALRALARRAKAAKRNAVETFVVSVSVRAPLIEVPPLSVAYQRLPDYCLKAMNGGVRAKG